MADGLSESSGAYFVQEVKFSPSSEACAGWLYLPNRSVRKFPCVVLANGFSGTMDWIVPRFAGHFANGGIAALVFDYRHFGKSKGEPRQIVDIAKQQEDLRAAIAFSRRHHRIDPERIALWGTSLGGHHVVEVAREDKKIRAVVLNVPALDTVKGANLSEKMKRLEIGWATVVCSTALLYFQALYDYLRGLRGSSPHYLPVFGKPGRAFFADPNLKDRFDRVEYESPTWRNQVAARFLLNPPRYHEGSIENIEAPILASLAKDDIELSNDYVKNILSKAGYSEIKEYDCGHFDVYHGKAFERVAEDQVRFMRKFVVEDEGEAER